MEERQAERRMKREGGEDIRLTGLLRLARGLSPYARNNGATARQEFPRQKLNGDGLLDRSGTYSIFAQTTAGTSAAS